MFEKEAEEYRVKGKNEGYYLVTQEMEQEELDYIIDESFKDGAEFGYNKANEWHYVKDGDLPKHENEVLVLLKDKTMQVDYYFSKVGWNISMNTDVIAWKEIVLPKKEQKEKEQNKDWMYQQRERNELGADYFSYQGYHPPKN